MGRREMIEDTVAPAIAQFAFAARAASRELMMTACSRMSILNCVMRPSPQSRKLGTSGRSRWRGLRGCVIVTVDYRLAPETSDAGSVEDNYAGLKWLHASTATLGVDRARIGVMGESAGGGHAALLAIAARDRGKVSLAFQCLTYPMLDDHTGSSVAAPPSVGRIIWTAQDNRLGWEFSLGMEPGTPNVPANAVPARVSDLGGLPPAFIGGGSIDLFVNEDIDFAQRLNNAGVSTELVVVPGAFHGFDPSLPRLSWPEYDLEKKQDDRRSPGRIPADHPIGLTCRRHRDARWPTTASRLVNS